MKKQKATVQIINIKEFKQLIEKAKKESVQLQQTTEQIKKFDFKTKVKY